MIWETDDSKGLPLPRGPLRPRAPSAVGYVVAAAALCAVRIAARSGDLRRLAAASPARLLAVIAVQIILWGVVGVTAAWVAKDAWRHGWHRLWAVGVLLLWPIVFPIYVGGRFGFAKGVVAALGVGAWLVFSVLATALLMT